GGCPWDRAQTHRSLMPYLLEEASEALEALEEGDQERLCEELGDLLLEVLLQVQIAEELGEFTLTDVVRGIAGKLVRRHPHVFGDDKLETAEQVVEQWEELKGEERADASALAGVPATLPALAGAQALQRRSHRAGFRWPSVDDAWRKLEEELAELSRAQTPAQREEEVGDALFALCDLARWLEVDAELALRRTNRTFQGRFQAMESRLRGEEREMAALPLAELLALWRETKGQ
ncbi:MAG: nucleoside triphosphate pyrophosphohydrolase, partial [Dehalococcoidia bacterium]